jgi:hypothetical protein
MIPAMIAPLRHFLGWLLSAFRSHEDLVLENLALHHDDDKNCAAPLPLLIHNLLFSNRTATVGQA